MSWISFYLVALLVTWWCSGCAYVVSSLLHPNSVLIAGVFVALILGAFLQVCVYTSAHTCANAHARVLAHTCAHPGTQVQHTHRCGTDMWCACACVSVCVCVCVQGLTPTLASARGSGLEIFMGVSYNRCVCVCVCVCVCRYARCIF